VGRIGKARVAEAIVGVGAFSPFLDLRVLMQHRVKEEELIDGLCDAKPVAFDR